MSVIVMSKMSTMSMTKLALDCIVSTLGALYYRVIQTNSFFIIKKGGNNNDARKKFNTYEDSKVR